MVASIIIDPPTARKYQMTNNGTGFLTEEKSEPLTAALEECLASYGGPGVISADDLAKRALLNLDPKLKSPIGVAWGCHHVLLEMAEVLLHIKNEPEFKDDHERNKYWDIFYEKMSGKFN